MDGYPSTHCFRSYFTNCVTSVEVRRLNCLPATSSPFPFMLYLEARRRLLSSSNLARYSLTLFNLFSEILHSTSASVTNYFFTFNNSPAKYSVYQIRLCDVHIIIFFSQWFSFDTSSHTDAQVLTPTKVMDRSRGEASILIKFSIPLRD